MLHVSRAKSALPRNNAGCNFLVRIQAHDRMGSIITLFKLSEQAFLSFCRKAWLILSESCKKKVETCCLITPIASEAGNEREIWYQIIFSLLFLVL